MFIFNEQCQSASDNLSIYDILREFVESEFTVYKALVEYDIAELTDGVVNEAGLDKVKKIVDDWVEKIKTLFKNLKTRIMEKHKKKTEMEKQQSPDAKISRSSKKAQQAALKNKYLKIIKDIIAVLEDINGNTDLEELSRDIREIDLEIYNLTADGVARDLFDYYESMELADRVLIAALEATDVYDKMLCSSEPDIQKAGFRLRTSSSKLYTMAGKLIGQLNA